MKERGIIALDGMDAFTAFKLASQLSGKVWGFKANDLLDQDKSPEYIVGKLAGYGNVFADVKVHDIPNTARNRVRHYAKHGAHLITVHASGGPEMLRATVDEYKASGPPNGLGILAVTLLTSINPEGCEKTYKEKPRNVVTEFARWAWEAGCYGIVCSPQELITLQGLYPRLKRVTPGVRSVGAATHDQARVDTPFNAVVNGADYQVIGRQVTEAKDPIAEVEALDVEMTEAARSIA